MDTPLLAALEIGSSRTVLLVGEPDENGRMRVIGKGCVDSSGVSKGRIVNLEYASQCVSKVVSKVVEEKKFDIGRVILAAGGGFISSLQNQGMMHVSSRDRIVTQEDVAEVNELAGNITLPSPTAARMHTIPKKYFLDEQSGIVRPEGLKGSRLGLGMLIICTEKGPIENLECAAKAASLDVEDVVFDALAASQAVLSQEQKDAGVAVIDLGGGTTGYIAYVDGVPDTAGSLGVGGDHVTNDILRAFTVSRRHAEKLKREYGSALVGGGTERISVSSDFVASDRTISLKALRTVTNARMDELFKIIRDEFDSMGIIQKLGAGIVFTGGGAALPGIVELATSIFGVPCSIASLRNVSGLEEEEHPESFAVQAGLLVYGWKAYEDSQRRKGGFLGSIMRGLGI